MTCYICSAPRTSDEHVPPRCFFPEGMRNNLFTVPSCEDHNTSKSKDDEYVRNLICSSFGSNLHGVSLATSKVVRSFQRSNGLIHTTFEDTTLLKLLDGGETIALTVNLDRFDRVMNSIAYGLYYLEFGTTFKGTWEIVPYSLTTKQGLSGSSTDDFELVRSKLNAVRYEMRPVANPEIFRYGRFVENANRMVYKFIFYEGFLCFAVTK